MFTRLTIMRTRNIFTSLAKHDHEHKYKFTDLAASTILRTRNTLFRLSFPRYFCCWNQEIALYVF